MRRRASRASRATVWGLFGATLLVTGCFAPIVALPGGNAATLISAGSIPARLILVAALGSVGLLLFRQRRALLIPGAFAVLMIFIEFLAYGDRLAVVAGPDSSANAVLTSLTTEWGWASLVAGAGLLLMAGLFPGRHRRPRRTP